MPRPDRYMKMITLENRPTPPAIPREWQNTKMSPNRPPKNPSSPNAGRAKRSRAHGSAIVRP